MEIASGTISILTNVFQLGNNLVRLWQSLRDARKEINEQVLVVENCWNRTRAQLELTQRIWTSLSNDHQAIHEKNVAILQEKLESAVKKISRLMSNQKDPKFADQQKIPVKRWKYLFLKPYLNDTIKSLEKWQAIYDPSWYLIIRIASPAIDAELQRPATTNEGTLVLNTATQIRSALRGGNPEHGHLFLSKEGLDEAQAYRIPYSSATHVRREGTNRWFIVDPVPCLASRYVGLMTKDIRLLAGKLYHADPSTFGILKCRGAMKVNRSSGGKLIAFELVFEALSTDKPRSLRSCLISRTSHTLTERLEVAKQLAKSVNYVHTLDFVHKNIRLENMVGFGDTSLGPFFLVGFEQVRTADGRTYLQGDMDWQKNIYRHPTRQGLSLDQPYCMQHDIYSLGVCLLEIGLWESFVLHGQNGPYPNTSLFRLSIEELRRKSPVEVKELLVRLARQELPRAVGEIYSEVVLNCLTCLDDDNMDFGDESEFQDEDGVAVGVRYIEKILFKLDSICV